MSNVIIDGLEYSIDTVEQTAAVVYQNKKQLADDIVVKSFIELDGVKYNVTSIRQSAFSDSNIKSIVIPNGVTSIGKTAFKYCRELKCLSLPNTLTSVEKEAFAFCGEIEVITGEKAIDIKLINTVVKQHIPSYLLNNPDLKEIKYIILDQEDIFKNKDISKYVFNYVSDNLDLYDIEKIKLGFKKKQPFITPLLQTLNTNILKLLFDNKICSYDVAKVMLDEVQMNSKCKTLFENFLSTASDDDKKELTKSINKKNEIESGTEKCTLKDIKEEWKCTKKDNKIYFKAYIGTKKTVTIPAQIDGLSDYVIQPLTENKTLCELIFANGITNIEFENKKDGTPTFRACSNLKTIVLPKTLTDFIISFNIGYSDIKLLSENEEGAFVEPMYVGDVLLSLGDYSVKDFVVKEGTKTIQIINSSFYKNLKSITIPNTVTRIGISSFRECISLESIVIPDSVTYLGSGAFANCESLNNVIIPSNIKEISGATFAGCNSLDNVTISNGIQSIGGSAFANCNALKQITIPSTVETMSRMVFDHCEYLETVIFEEGSLLKKIEYSTYNHCGRLKNINIPENVIEIENIAFWFCKSLETVTIPKSVEVIGFESFACCDNLKTVNIESTETKINKASFRGCPLLNKN